VGPLVASAPNVRAVHDIGPDDSNVLFIRAEASRGPAVAGGVRDILGEGALVTTPRSLAGVLGSTFSLIDRFGAAVGGAGLLVAALALLRATAASLVERRRDVGLLRAVGWARRSVMAQLTGETLVTAALGVAAGLAMAMAVARGLSLTEVTVPVPWELSPTPHFLPGGAKEVAMTVRLPARVTAGLVGGAVALGMALSGLLSLWLSRRSAAVKPAEVFRGE
ncbi:MAG: FtsX-like permease family protein, partial [Actinomycetota bacterium]|nr:FtsX-like permease family protein [Actinomycetota bacterium]